MAEERCAGMAMAVEPEGVYGRGNDMDIGSVDPNWHRMSRQKEGNVPAVMARPWPTESHVDNGYNNCWSQVRIRPRTPCIANL
ncbi:hypothetical protein BVX99_02425 [bacterium F16]|nr:hypothetical protein BVX99_02425 [bacterium F16]